MTALRDKLLQKLQASTLVLLSLLTMVGCAPSSTINGPLTARPAPQMHVPQGNGSIYQAGVNERPLFEDVRARNIGDVLVINLVESTSATQKNASGATHTGSANASIQRLGAGLPIYNGGSSNKFSNSVANSGSNVLSGTLTVTVVEVLANGNLLVAGEKIVSINQVREFIRLSGVVNPRTILAGNMVQSTQVADARIEYKGADSNLDNASLASSLSRWFQSIAPF